MYFGNLGSGKPKRLSKRIILITDKSTKYGLALLLMLLDAWEYSHASQRFRRSLSGTWLFAPATCLGLHVRFLITTFETQKTASASGLLFVATNSPSNSTQLPALHSES